MGQEHNSGQTGTVTLLARGASRTLVRLQIFSVPRGRREIARVARARACRGARPTAVFPVWAGLTGEFGGIVTLGVARLLSGNYIVEVFVRPGGARLSCGELHR
jgi:hypothetical protein